jgi:hypothetical protein
MACDSRSVLAFQNSVRSRIQAVLPSRRFNHPELSSFSRSINRVCEIKFLDFGKLEGIEDLDVLTASNAIGARLLAIFKS